MSTPLALLLSLALQDVPASSPPPPSEPISIGGGGALVLLMPCFIPTLRFSLPFNGYLAIDADVGPSLFWGDPEVGQVPDGLAFDAQLRWLRKGRKSDGRGRYWLFGVSYAQGRRVTQGVVTQDNAFRNAQVGYGWDQLINGYRAGFEIKVSPVGDGEGHARLFVVWGRR